MHADTIHSLRKTTRRITLSAFGVLFVAIQLVAFFANAVNAAPATNYTWKDRQTISVSGGDVKPNQFVSVNINDPVPTTGSGTIQTSEVLAVRNCTLWVFCGTSNVTNDCTVALTLNFSNGGSQATLSAKQIATIGSPGSNGPCSQATYDEYDGKTVAINGTRPIDANTTVEQASQKTTQIEVDSHLSSADAPASIIILVDTAPANLSAQKSVTATKSDIGGNVKYIGSFQLEAGNYVASVNGLTIPPHSFTKIKYQFLYVGFGDSEGFGGRQVLVTVTIKTLGGMGASSVGPLDVNLYDAAGSKVISSSKTNAVAITDTAQTDSRTYNLLATLDNIDPGSYKLCIGTDKSICQDITKAVNSTKSVNFVITGQMANNLINVTANNAPTCGSTVANVGWIVCPIINSLSSLNDGMWGLVSGLLKINPIQTSDNIYKAWGIIRNVANVAFVIVFLIVIFSQLSSAGISNYGVKKMLPRMIIGAILVNLSFIVIQIAVDVANILGSSIYDAIVNLAPVVDISWTTLVSAVVGSAAGGVLLAAGIPMLGGASAVLLMILPMIAVAALGLLTAVLTLIFRQAAIPILAILAPLAFVAYLLPNTESWYKKWQSLLIKMLMMYPLAGLLFGGAHFAATTVFNEGGWWTMLIGLIILTLPLFSLPFLVRQGGSILGKVGGALNNLASKANKPINNWAGGKRELAEKKYMSTNPSDISKYNVGKRMRFGALRGKQADKAKSSAYDRMISENTDEDILAGKLDSKLGPETALREKDAAALRQKKRENELIESGAQNIRRTYGSTGTIGAPGVQGGAEKAFAEAFASGDRVKMLSAMSVLASAGPPGIDKLHNSVLGVNQSQNPELFSSFLNELNTIPGLKSKDAALAKLAYTEGGQLSDIAQERSTYSGLSAADAASQTEASLRRIQATDGMLPSVAQAILQNETLSGQLTPVTQKIIEDIASGNTASSTGTGSAKQAAEATLEQAAAGTSGTNPFIVDGSGVINQNSARARVEAAATQAAQGTAGYTPFVVDHSGTASQPKQAGDVGSHTDDQGRQTPDGTAEGYHDYFNH